jgi:hypothetical protein
LPSSLVATLATIGAETAFVRNPETLQTLGPALVGHWILLTGVTEGALGPERLSEWGGIARKPLISLAEPLSLLYNDK